LFEVVAVDFPSNKRRWFIKLLQLLLTPIQQCVVLFHNLTIINDSKFINVYGNLVNDGINPTVVSGGGEVYYDMLKLIGRLTIKVPENKNDLNYQRVFFQTSIDIEKFFNGIGGHFLMKQVMRDLRDRSFH
jgi:hypothetical protein